MRQSDDVIRRVFAVLDQKAMQRDAMVVITADHGQRTAERGLLCHGGEADAPTLKIPLLIYDPCGTPYLGRAPASQIDVAPTILRSIGLAARPGWKEGALQDAVQRDAVPVGTSESTGTVAQKSGAVWLYLCNRGTGKETVTHLEGAWARANLNELRRQHRQVAAPVKDATCRK